MKKIKLPKLSKRKKIILAILLVAALAVLVLILNKPDKKQAAPPPPKKYYSQLTGQEVSKDQSELPVLAVMIENSEEARPQTGLDSAGIVFETVTEGGITRYMALFQENTPKEVGPVRSVRPAFVNWLMGFDASVAHVGGSEEALELVEKLGAKSLNQFTYPEPYYRINTRVAPHNMYAHTEGLRDLQKKLNHKKSNFRDIPRSDAQPTDPVQVSTITVNFSSPLFATEYRYDKATNTYTRYLAGAPHIDAATNKPITVTNLIVLKMSTDSINAISKGDAYIFKDGKVQTAIWRQIGEEERIELLDTNNNEVSLNRGDSWIAAIPSSGSLTY